jgi:hypothetical protein
MAYKGEDIPIVITGDNENNLDEVDFKVLFYPHDTPDNPTILLKSDMTKEEENMYSGKIPFSTTKTMPIGYYTIEILTIGEERRIFKKDGAFTLYDSASKDIE